jgi:hypothetical protein
MIRRRDGFVGEIFLIRLVFDNAVEMESNIRLGGNENECWKCRQLCMWIEGRRVKWEESLVRTECSTCTLTLLAALWVRATISLTVLSAVVSINDAR